MKQGGDRSRGAGFTISAAQQWYHPSNARRSRTGFARTPGLRQLGFTIVETLIVMAVTGFLLLTAILYIAGKQNRTQFMTGINDLQQQLQQIINETSSGFPGGTDFKCQGSIASTTPTVSPVVRPQSNPLALNQGCVFVGKVIQFGPSTLSVYPLVGNQHIGSGNDVQEIQSIQDSYPIAIWPDGTSSTVDESSDFALENGLTVLPTAPTTTGAVGIVSSFGAYSGCTGLCSGSQQFTLYNITGAAAALPKATVVSKIDASNAANFAQAPNGVSVCFVSGTTTQSGLITIGGGNGLSVGLTIYGTKTCT